MAVDPSVLEQFAALEPLGESGRVSMAPLLTSTRYKAGSQICREGDDGDSCYMLSEGTVEVVKNLPDGRRVKLATLSAGTLFGQAGLVPNQVRTAEVRAEVNVTILSLSRDTLNWALDRGAEWAVAIQAIVAVNLVQQLRSALDRLGELASSEDVAAEITGTKRADARKAVSLNADFSGARKKARQAADSAGVGSFGFSDDEPIATPAAGLLEMLRATEASLASAGFDTDNVEFVFDEDMIRTAEARKG